MLDVNSRAIQLMLTAFFFTPPEYADYNLCKKVDKANAWYGEDSVIYYEDVRYESEFLSLDSLEKILGEDAKELINGFMVGFSALLGTSVEDAVKIVEEQRERRSRYNVYVSTGKPEKVQALIKALSNLDKFEPIRELAEKRWNDNVIFSKKGGLNSKERELVRLFLQEQRAAGVNIGFESFDSKKLVSFEQMIAQEGEAVWGTLSIVSNSISRDMRNILACLNKDNYFELLRDEKTKVKHSIVLDQYLTFNDEKMNDIYNLNNAQQKLTGIQRSDFILTVNPLELQVWIKATQPDIWFEIQTEIPSIQEEQCSTPRL